MLCIEEAPKLFVRKCDAEVVRPAADCGGVEGASIDGMATERCKPPPIPLPAANSTTQLALIHRERDKHGR